MFLSFPFEYDWYSLVIVFRPIPFSNFSKGKNSPKGTRFIFLYEFIIFRLWSKIDNELKCLIVLFSSSLLLIPIANKWFSLNLFSNNHLYSFSWSCEIPGIIPSGQIKIIFSLFFGELISISSSIAVIGSTLL